MQNIIKRIEAVDYFTHDISFNFAADCGNLLTGSDNDRLLARSVAIRVLDRWGEIPETTRPIWGDIIEAVGFYPYLEKNSDTISVDSLADKIRQKSFLSEYLPDVYMHTKQKELSNYLHSDKNIIASAPTSFGKSLLIKELVASQKHQNIVIIQPTLALLDETRLKLKKYNDLYKIIVRTSQEPDINKGNLFLLTAERVMEYIGFPKISLLIIDEFYKMSLRRHDDRSDILNNAFLKIHNTFEPKFYLLGPNIDGVTDGFAMKYNAHFFKTDYSLVDCNVTSVLVEEKDKEKYLFNLLDAQIEQQTLVYCSSPARTRSLMRKYLKHLEIKNGSVNNNLPIIEWLEVNIPHWSVNKALAHGIAVHDGSLPKHLGTSIINYFNRGKIRCIFCTSTIIEGVNTNAKNVIIFDGKKGSKEIDFFDYSNIKGRSGRLMEHYLGNVYCFTPIPKETAIIVDVPFHEQDKDVLTSEILVNIQDKDVQPQVRQRYEKINSIDSTLLEIFKLNGTKIDGQIRIYNKLNKDIDNSYNLIAWNQLPTSEQIHYVLEMCENNHFNFDESHGVLSVKQLAVYLNIYRTKKSLKPIIKNIFEYSFNRLKNKTEQKKFEHYDKAVETAFHIYRHWFQFTVPKAFRIVDSLQRYVCEKRNKKSGSYSYFVQQLESDFIQSNLSILIEFGVPSETVRKIAPLIPDEISEDDVLQFIIENKDKLSQHIMQYEKDKLELCL